MDVDDDETQVTEGLQKALLALGGQPVPREPKNTAEETSRYYSRNNRLEWNHVITDGFYDPGNGRKFKPLSEYKGTLSEEQFNSGEREVIIIDEKNDERLAKIVEIAKCMSSMSFSGSMAQLLKYIAGLALGGFTENKDTLSRNHLIGRPVVRRLTEIDYGVCRHTSILIKYVGDKLGIPTWLQRGHENNEKHSWCVCFLDGKLQKVDMMDAMDRDTEWPVKNYKPAYPSKPPGDFVTRLTSSEEIVKGYFVLPSFAEKSSTDSGGIETRIEIGRLQCEAATTVMLNTSSFPCVTHISKVQNGYAVVANMATTLHEWEAMQIKSSMIDLYALLRSLVTAVYHIHQAGYVHGGITAQSVAVMSVPNNAQEVDSYSLIFPYVGASSYTVPANDWAAVEALYSGYYNIGNDNPLTVIFNDDTPGTRFEDLHSNLLKHFKHAVAGDAKRLYEFVLENDTTVCD
eukprot:TRINITY_DN34471_c0_g1_i1.p1 TRINITY_DN34471_c0_g1~~TRINITY_DN34471_c0_g1_i1.p1  ORF type:complete len:476 (+),score=69.54 TRINITY_DN34471_c0_g1_i1:52-1428(+)